MEKINISNYYEERSEVRVECNDGNYKDMYESINEVFNFNTLKSFIDLGCATGHLIKNIKKNHNIEVKGIEYFEYSPRFAALGSYTPFDMLDGNCTKFMALVVLK